MKPRTDAPVTHARPLRPASHEGEGLIALVGAGEFLPAMEEIDTELLRLAGGLGSRVAILPTAAGREDPDWWAERGVAHFRRLGVEAFGVMVVDRVTANDPMVVAPLRHAELIYLSGGDPRFLLETLSGSLAWRLILGRHASGALLAGCSAGAMVLGGWCFVGGELCCEGPLAWARGLSLLPEVAVLPHFDTIPPERREALLESVPVGASVIGIDELTAILRRKQTWRVLGKGSTTVVLRKNRRMFAAGDIVVLPDLRPR